MIEILKSVPAQVIVPKVVRDRELLTLQQLQGESNEDILQFGLAIEEKILLVMDFNSEVEEETFVNYVFELGDDGESATGAIAVHRNWAIATDDKKAISFFKKEAPYLQILSTLEIVKNWSKTANLSSATLRTVLAAIRTKGHYVPHRNHPLRLWWENIMSWT